MADRTAPFCCSKIRPQPPFHKQDHYPRSYTCLLEFLTLATSRRAGRLPPTHPTKPLTEHDFVVRLCKGHTDPQFGVNQWGAARYFLPDSFVRGGLIEVLDVEGGENHLESLRGLLSKEGGEGNFGGFLYLEDVWMTVLCPAHSDAVWFLQFWVKGPKDREALEEVRKRVRDRVNREPGFIEDEFTVRFNEMVGVPNRPPRGERDVSPEEDERQQDPGCRSIECVEGWRDQDEEVEQEPHFQERDFGFQFESQVGMRIEPSPRIPPGLLPPQFVRRQGLFRNYRDESSDTPSAFTPVVYQLGGDGTLEPHEAESRDFPPWNQPHPFGAVGDPILGRGIHNQGPPPEFKGTALQWEDPSLRPPFTPQTFSLRPPSGFRFGNKQGPPNTNADLSRAEIEHWQITHLHSPLPARHFDVGEMWQSPELAPVQPERPPYFLRPQGAGWGPEPYEVYRPEEPMPYPSIYQQPPLSRTNDGQDWKEDISHQVTFNPTHTNGPLLTTPSPGGPLETNNPANDIPRHDSYEYQNPSDGAPTAPAAMRDTSVAGQSAYAPPAGNTTGLRPVPRRTWDIAKKEWRTYWVWAL
ncbi:hypothetical protein L207DRAFT_236945 [Hyaloscypha variabilis F]|uniref:Uncharacterized protein n=1 Tax=Hyaloscypha variabilis (strain UAMH 11265 / GT02V1 / F) TaxID=1149755 RepID=A0A2J6QTF9_HYAVF|nr:hypothetical protein L207DRAFT_236945 [Hyaloscypha variabilis F]